MRVFYLAVAMALIAVQPATAQRRQGAGTAPSARAAVEKKSAEGHDEKEANLARARAEARERAWNERMKRTMRSICSGAAGC